MTVTEAKAPAKTVSPPEQPSRREPSGRPGQDRANKLERAGSRPAGRGLSTRLWGRPLLERLAPVLVVAVLLAVWEGVAQAHLVKPYLLPAPSTIGATFWQLLLRGTLARYLLLSLQHYALGLVWGVVGGVCFGLVTAWFRWADLAVEPIIGLLRPIPPIAWTPFAIIWIGINTQAAAFLIAIGAFYLTFFATYGGVKGVDPRLVEVARTLGDRSSVHILWRVVIPASLPSILVGIRTSLGQGWMTMVAAEMFGVQGLGMKMFEAAGLLRMDTVMAYMAVIGAVYFITDRVFRRVEAWLLRWR